MAWQGGLGCFTGRAAEMQCGGERKKRKEEWVREGESFEELLRQLKHEDRRAGKLDSAETFAESERGWLNDGQEEKEPQNAGRK